MEDAVEEILEEFIAENVVQEATEDVMGEAVGEDMEEELAHPSGAADEIKYFIFVNFSDDSPMNQQIKRKNSPRKQAQN